MANYEERSFLFRITEKLSSKERHALVAINQLPAKMRDQSGFDIILQLQQQEKYNKLEELAAMLKNIDRNDLAKEITEFAEKQRLSLDPSTKLECVFQETKEQFQTLTSQMEKLREAANEAGQKRIEQIVEELVSTWPSETLNKKLRYITGLLAMTKSDQKTPPPPSRTSSISSRKEDTTSKTETKSEKQKQTWSSKVPSHPRTQSDSVHQRSRPIMKKAQSQRQPSMESMTTTIQPSITKRELPPVPVDVPPKSTQVSNKPTPSPKPTVKPKPKNRGLSATGSFRRTKDNLSAAVNPDSDADYTGGTGGSEDSGFTDASQFIRQTESRVEPTTHDKLAAHVQPQLGGYMGLRRSTMEPSVKYYKTTLNHQESIQEATYSNWRDLEDCNEPVYVNISAIKRARGEL